MAKKTANDVSNDELAGMIQREFLRQKEWLDEKFESIDQRFESIDQRLNLIEQRLNQLESDVSGIKISMVRMESNIQEIKSRLDALDKRDFEDSQLYAHEITRLQQRVTSLEKQVKALKFSN